MWMNLYNFVHNSLGIHSWDLAALLVGVILLVEVIVHSYKQKRRENKFDEERTEELETMQKKATGRP